MSVPFGVALTCSDAFLSLKPQYIQEDPKGDRGLLRQSPSLHPVERPQRREVDRLPTWHGVAHSHQPPWVPGPCDLPSGYTRVAIVRGHSQKGLAGIVCSWIDTARVSAHAQAHQG